MPRSSNNAIFSLPSVHPQPIFGTKTYKKESLRRSKMCETFDLRKKVTTFHWEISMISWWSFSFKSGRYRKIISKSDLGSRVENIICIRYWCWSTEWPKSVLFTVLFSIPSITVFRISGQTIIIGNIAIFVPKNEKKNPTVNQMCQWINYEETIFQTEFRSIVVYFSSDWFFSSKS